MRFRIMAQNTKLKYEMVGQEMLNTNLKTETAEDFVAQNEKAKLADSEKLKLIKQLTTIARREHYDYADLKYIFRRVKESLDVKPARKLKVLPTVLTDDELERFFKVIEIANIVHYMLFRLMYVTGCRISEVCNIKLMDINVEANKISVVQGKGSKDRTVLFPEDFKVALKMYLESRRNQTWLFESQQYKQYSARRVQQLFKIYRCKAAIEKEITPHSLRHQCLTYLTSKGLTDSQLQMISGHSNKDTLAIYQHLSLNHVEKSYQQAFG